MTVMPSHITASSVAALGGDALNHFLAALSIEDRARLHYTWTFWARAEQLAPATSWKGLPWSTWVILAGRGFGKTRTAAEWVIEKTKTTGRIALIADTAADARDVIVQGESGIMACSPPWNRPIYNPSLRRVTWPNGAVAITYSGEDPDQLRGPQHGAAVLDEFAKYRYAKDVWDQMQFGLRLGESPQALITTTPRPIKILKEILVDDTTAITRGSTFANAANLSAKFFAAVKRAYEGTRLGRQELYGEILNDTPGALWTYASIDAARVREIGDLDEVAVAVDPSGSKDGDEVGIVAAGRKDKDFYVLSDKSGKGMTPNQWATQAITLYDREDILADRLVAERNYGGDMVGNLMRRTAEDLFRRSRRDTPDISYQDVVASRGKVLRAQPSAALYEQGRVHHVGEFKELEDEMSRFTLDWDRTKDGSPNRVDALVFVLAHLARNMSTTKMFAGAI